MARDVKISVAGNGELRYEGVCTVTGATYAVDVPFKGWQQWQTGSRIQDCLPELSPEQREFILNGVTPAEWKMLTDELSQGE